MNFSCPKCQMALMAESEMAGQVVKCPGCNTRLQIPAASLHSSDPGDEGIIGGLTLHRNVWKEEDPTNPNPALSFGIGMGLTLVWFAIIYFFQAPDGKVASEFTTGEVLANLFYKHFTVSFANTLFFFWASGICYLKLLKLRHQRRAMLLDVLPRELGNSINAQNVGSFIDHVYGLPVSLRDSLMVNRIRKALEFFEVRQNVADVSSLMASQSGIDGSRIMGSYIMPRAFLWAIPLLGFIGTVIGLSHAISGMSFSNVEDVSKIVGSINNVTSGLGTAFDATLLGLIFAVVLNFPLNSLSKNEEETLNDIDAYCNEVLLPRLADGPASKTEKEQQTSERGLESLGEVTAALVDAMTLSQRDFLGELNALSGRMMQYADALELRNEQYEQKAIEALSERLQFLEGRSHDYFSAIERQNEQALERFIETIARIEASARTLHESTQHAEKEVLQSFSARLLAVTDGMSKSIDQSLHLTGKAVSGLSEHVTRFVAVSNTNQDALYAAQEGSLKAFSARMSDIASGAEASMAASLEATQKTFSRLEGGIVGLNTVLEQLGSKQVIIQQVKRKGWFSRE